MTFLLYFLDKIELGISFVAMTINYTYHFKSDLLFKIIIYFLKESVAKHFGHKPINSLFYIIFRHITETKSFFFFLRKTLFSSP